jgi:hypothetical protein
MKRESPALITALFVLLASFAYAKEEPTKTQVQNLFESVSRAVPKKVRVVSLHITEKAPPSDAEIKRNLDNARKRSKKEQQGVPESQRTKYIEENLRLRMLTMTGKDYHKIQEWKSGLLYRLDKAWGYTLEQADLKTNYNTTYINLVNETNGAISSVTINNGTKSFERNSNSKSRWTQVGAWNAITVEPKVAYFVGAALASTESMKRKVNDENQKLIIDPLKLQQVLSGQDSAFKIYLDEKVVNGQQVYDFVFDIKNGAATVLIECNKTNFNQITRTEIKDTDGIVLSSERGQFDSQDFPHKYFLIENQQYGYVTNRFDIKEVELNASFSDDEVFRFAPPKNYGVVDMSSGTPKIESFPGGVKPQKIIDISTPLKEPGWYESRTFIRAVMLTLCFVPPLIALYLNLKKRFSKPK